MTTTEYKNSENTSSADAQKPENHSAPAVAASVDFDATFEQLCDPLLPARGHALMRLAGLLRARDAKALEKIDVLLKTFQDSLIHDDSYIYLAAIEGLVAAADVKPDEVIPYLVREFVTCHGKQVEGGQTKDDVEQGKYPGCKGEYYN